MSSLIAIVDDDQSVRRALGRLLRSEGYEVEAFGSAQELLTFDRRALLSCLVVDVYLGGMSGLDLMEAMAAEGNRLPTVVITAYDDEATHERADKAGAFAYLRKPLDAPILLSAVSSAIDGASRG